MTGSLTAKYILVKTALHCHEGL